jgi:hypothetical protein
MATVPVQCFNVSKDCRRHMNNRVSTGNDMAVSGTPVDFKNAMANVHVRTSALAHR